MIPAPTSLELRKHPRAQLRLPARIRWRGPLGMRMESTHTLDVSRNGIRLQRNESCEYGSRVWVVFPFEAASAAGVLTRVGNRHAERISGASAKSGHERAAVSRSASTAARSNLEIRRGYLQKPARERSSHFPESICGKEIGRCAPRQAIPEDHA